MSCIIKIPARTHENFGDSISKLISLLNELSACKGKEIILDFSEARLLNPFFLGGLVCVMNNMKSEGIKFELNHDSNIFINSYLRTIHFPSAFSPSLEGQEKYLDDLESYKAKTYIPIVSFKTGPNTETTIVREKLLAAVSELLKNQLGFTEKATIPLRYFISELTDNINEHSKAPEGYLFAQFYPSSNYIDICICDSGQGIMQSYLNNPKYDPKTESDAMKFAVFGKSTKNSGSRGFGISTTRNMLVNGLRGKLFIWSGHTGFMQVVENESILDMGDSGLFKGTFIALRMPTIIPGGFDLYRYTEG